jgi:single-strand DNA-binding protein
MLNKVILMGRLTRDVELNYTPNTGNAVAKYSIAVDRNGKKDQENQTDFINIVAWGKNAEFASQYLKKGSLIIVEGRLQMSKWTDKDGKTRTSYDVVAEGHQFVPGSKKVDGAVANNATTESSGGDFEEVDMTGVDEKDLPF